MKRNKWTRRQATRKKNLSHDKKLKIEINKHHLIDVMIIGGTLEGCGSGEKKRKSQSTLKEIQETKPEVLLEGQHRLSH